MDFILAVIQAIPDSVWGTAIGGLSALFGGLITLAGMRIANKHSAKMQQASLEHDSKQKSLDRKLGNRREVYLRAAEEMVKANSYLGTLSSVDLSKENISDGLRGLFTASSQVALIAEPETAQKVSELTTYYSSLLLRLGAKVAPISQLRSNIEIVESLYNKASAQQERILNERWKIIESGQQDAERFNALERTGKFHTEECERHTKELNRLREKLGQEMLSFSKDVLTEMTPIGQLTLDAQVALRSELGVDTNIEEYKKFVQAQVDRIKVEIEQILQTWEKKFPAPDTNSVD